MHILIVLLMLLAPSSVWAAGTCDYDTSSCSGSTPWTADSASYNDVNYCINTCAGPGDTINVPAGDVTWTDYVNITTGVIIIGAGIDVTTIAAPGVYAFFRYEPSNEAANLPYRVSGFTFDMTGMSSYGLLVRGTTVKSWNSRIDHNKFTNHSAGRCINWRGSAYGVADHNTFISTGGKIFDAYGKQLSSWAAFWDDRDFGTKDNCFFEDNTVTHPGAATSDGQGGRYVLRFNDYTATSNY